MYDLKEGTVGTEPWDQEILIHPDCSTFVKFNLWNGQTFRVEFEANLNAAFEDTAEASIIIELRAPIT